MTRDDPAHRSDLTTGVSIIHLRAQLLRRQVRQRADLPSAERQRLEQGLGAIVATTRELAALVVAAEEAAERREPPAMPPLPLVAVDRFPRN